MAICFVFSKLSFTISIFHLGVDKTSNFNSEKKRQRKPPAIQLSRGKTLLTLTFGISVDSLMHA